MLGKRSSKESQKDSRQNPITAKINQGSSPYYFKDDLYGFVVLRGSGRALFVWSKSKVITNNKALE